MKVTDKHLEYFSQTGEIHPELKAKVEKKVAREIKRDFPKFYKIVMEYRARHTPEELERRRNEYEADYQEWKRKRLSSENSVNESPIKEISQVD